jgi:hypothetical protein
LYTETSKFENSQDYAHMYSLEASVRGHKEIILASALFSYMDE